MKICVIAMCHPILYHFRIYMFPKVFTKWVCNTKIIFCFYPPCIPGGKRTPIILLSNYQQSHYTDRPEVT